MEESLNHAGAIASNAGDDFHLIWVGKKVIEMLKPDNELSAVVVEGPAWEDSVVVEDQSLLYSIDMTEYYGGKNFDSSKRVVFSQLKYSAYLPEKEWNLSRLCASSDKKQSNSVIRRMADTYKGFAEKKLGISGKIVLKFVSNQVLAQDIKESIAECKKILSKKLYKQAAALINKLNEQHKNIVSTIYKTSKLSSEQFIGFVQVLDFGDCGTGVRQIHEIEIMRQIGIWGFHNQKSSYNNLIMAIRKCMLPEGKDTIIDKNWVKSVLEIDERNIFPAPSRIVPPNVKYIVKRGEKDTVAQFLKNTKRWTCFYGIAGAGKTTFVGNIEKYLPKESVVILYDCYGGGTFLQPDQPRHNKEIAIRQICNMLALKCKTELLLGTINEEYLWWDALKKRLIQASELVCGKNSEALVVVIIDAADNSMFAANTMKQKCFLCELLELDLPKNIRIVATARTERMSSLPEIEKAEKLEIPLFNKENSLDYLKAKFPEVTNEIGEEFHELTNGNPRLQNYIVSTAKELDKALDFVRPDGKKLEDIFDGFIESVKKQYIGAYNIDLVFFAASRIIRPVPIEIICNICGISFEMLNSICVECHYGLYNKNKQLSFRDEDFENYLQSRFSDSEYFMSEIADYLYAKRNEDAYCARYVHLFLDAANQFEKIIQISLNEEVDGTSVGVAQSNKVMLARINTALARPEIRRVDVYKLIYRQADFCAGEDSLSKLLFEAPEEISIFCDEMSIRSVIASSDNSFAALGRKALLSAKLPDGKEYAKDYINMFTHKLYKYYGTEKEDRIVDRPRKDDIVRIAETLLICGDIDQACCLLEGWNPKKAAIPYINSFFKKQFVYKHQTDVGSLLERKWSLPNLLSLICAFITNREVVPCDLAQKIDNAFDRMKMIPLDRFSFENVIQYFEYKCAEYHEKNRVGSWLEKIVNKPSISSDMSFWNDEESRQLELCFRYYALICVCQNCNIGVEKFYVRKESERKKKWYDKDSKLEKYKFLYEFFLFRIKGWEDGTDNIDTYISQIYQKLDRYSFYVSMNIEDQYLYEKAGIVFLEGISNIKNISEKICHTYVSKLFKGSWRREFYLKATDILSNDRKMYNECLFVLNKIDKMMTDSPEYAEGMVNTFLHCAKVASRIDRLIGKKYFRKAVASTKQADTYSYRKIELIHGIISNCKGENKCNNEVLAYKLAGICENYLRTLDDTKNFPYEKMIAACTLLGEKGVWSTLCRMDDRNECNWLAIEDTLPYALRTLLDKKKMDIWQVIALSIFLLPERANEYYMLMQKVLDTLNGIKLDKKRNILKFIIDDILYNVPMSDKEKFINCFTEYLDRNPTDPELDVREIVDMIEFLNVIKSERSMSEYDNSSIIHSHDGELTDSLNKLQDNDCVSGVKNVLDHMVCRDGKYNIYQLNYVADYVEEKAYLMDINHWRNDFDTRWNYYIKMARQFINDYWDNSIYEQANRIFKYSLDEKFTFMTQFLKQNHLFSADEYVQALQLMAECLEPQEAIELLEWIIKIEWEKCCAAYSGSVSEFLGIVDANTERKEADFYIAMFLWRMLGHPDKKNRYRAQHVIWRYIVFEDAILSYFYELYNEIRFSELYLDKGNYFFRESAQISFLEASLHIAGYAPAVLVTHYQFYENIASSKGVQHALKRHLAIKICKKLKPICNVIEKVSLDDCEKCIYTEKVKGMRRYEREQGSNKELHFHIDTMDTTRYWYDDVAEIFGCTQGEVTELCDFYIANELQITDLMADSWQQKYFRRQDYGRAYNDHGAIPSYETLRKYAEWHSMFYAADYLRCSRSVVEDEDINYNLWLDRFIPGQNDVWTYEMRSYPPLKRLFWEPEFLSGRKGKEGYKIPENFVTMIMEENQDVILSLECSNKDKQCRKYVSVISIVIQNKDLEKFIMKSKKDPYVIYDFLYRDEDWENSESSFAYPTCIDKESFSDKASDMKDPLSKGHLELQNCVKCLSKDVFQNLKEPDYKELRPRVNMINKFLYRKWCEPEMESGYDKIGTYGSWLSVDKDYMLSVLQKNLWTLVCKIVVELEDEYNSYKMDQEKIKQEFLWLMKTDGSIDIVRL